MSDQTPEVPETGVPADAAEVVAPEAGPAVPAPEDAVAQDAVSQDAVSQDAPIAPGEASPPEQASATGPGAPAADVPPPPPPTGVPAPPPGYFAPAAGTVPVFPNGKPMLDALGQPVSDKSRLAAALLCWFVGVLGVHRFYVGKVGTGVAMLLTCGGLGVWALIDLIVILLGSFKDATGRNLQNW